MRRSRARSVRERRWLYLPRYTGGEAAAEPKAAEKRDVGKLASETVLVVEDNPGVRDLTVRRLGMLGYEVLVAENGPAAVAVFETGEKIDLVFSDVVMAGGMSGVDLARWVRGAAAGREDPAYIRLRRCRRRMRRRPGSISGCCASPSSRRTWRAPSVRLFEA